MYFEKDTKTTMAENIVCKIFEKKRKKVSAILIVALNSFMYT